MFKNKLVLIIGMLVLVVAVVLGLKYSGLYGTGSMKSSPPANLVIPAGTVIIQGNSFNPETLTVKVGQKVTWTNNDSYAHTVTSDDGSFNSGSLPAGQSFSFVFTKTGSFNYHCSIHTSMTAKVVVTN
jgi:plastocyanin